MSYLGDFYLGANIDSKFTTVNTSGVPTMLTGSPAVVAYPDNSTTEITSGLTLTTNFDGRSGLNHVRVAATAANGYATGTNYSLVLSTGTVGGNFIGGYTVKEFSIEARAALRSTPDGRDIALSPAGFVDINDKTSFSLSSPQNFNLVGNITGSVVGNLQGYAGTVTGSVQSVLNPVTVGTNNDKSGYSLSSPQNFDLVGNISGTLTNVNNVVSPVTVGTNNDKSGYGLATGTLLDAISDVVWDEQLGGHQVTGSAGRILNDAASAGSDPWLTSLPGAYAVGQAGHIVGTYIDTHISSRMPSGTVSVGDKTGFSLSSPQNFNLIGNVSGTLAGNVLGYVGQVTGSVLSVTNPVTVGVNNDKTGYSLSSPQNFNLIGNISGTFMGNISGTVGAVSGLVSSRLDVNISSRMATGTMVNANLKQIDEQDTNGNNATLNLKKLNIVNSTDNAVHLEASGNNKDVVLIEQSNFGGGGGAGLYILSNQALGAPLYLDAEGGADGVVVYTVSGDALHLISDGANRKSINAPQDIAVSDGDLTLTNIAKKILTLDWTTVTGEAVRSVLNALRKLRNKVSFNGTDTLTVYKEDGTTSAYTQSVVEDTNQDPFKEVGN